MGQELEGCGICWDSIGFDLDLFFQLGHGSMVPASPRTALLRPYAA